MKMFGFPARRISELLRSYLMFWRWPARLRCHRNILCCQYIDRPNDNQKS
jgi:hypothetical protein